MSSKDYNLREKPLTSSQILSLEKLSLGNKKEKELEEKTSRLYTPGLDNTRLFMSLTAGAGT